MCGVCGGGGRAGGEVVGRSGGGGRWGWWGWGEGDEGVGRRGGREGERGNIIFHLIIFNSHNITATNHCLIQLTDHYHSPSATPLPPPRHCSPIPPLSHQPLPLSHATTTPLLIDISQSAARKAQQD